MSDSTPPSNQAMALHGQYLQCIQGSNGTHVHFQLPDGDYALNQNILLFDSDSPNEPVSDCVSYEELCRNFASEVANGATIDELGIQTHDHPPQGGRILACAACQMRGLPAGQMRIRPRRFTRDRWVPTLNFQLNGKLVFAVIRLDQSVGNQDARTYAFLLKGGIYSGKVKAITASSHGGASENQGPSHVPAQPQVKRERPWRGSGENSDGTICSNGAAIEGPEEESLQIRGQRVSQGRFKRQTGTGASKRHASPSSPPGMLQQRRVHTEPMVGHHTSRTSPERFNEDAWWSTWSLRIQPATTSEPMRGATDLQECSSGPALLHRAAMESGWQRGDADVMWGKGAESGTRHYPIEIVDDQDTRAYLSGPTIVRREVASGEASQMTSHRARDTIRTRIDVHTNDESSIHVDVFFPRPPRS